VIILALIISFVFVSSSKSGNTWCFCQWVWLEQWPV